MSGHSKWANIKNKKGKTDAARGNLFTKIGKELQIAVKAGGPNPDANSKLKDVIAKAKAANMPNDNIMRSIKRASGEGANEIIEEISYEGYGPAGIAIIAECATDNRNRTASEVRHYFDKYGGNLGATGCVSWSFDKKGVIVVNNEDGDLDEDTVMEAAMEAGADDLVTEEEIFTIYTAPDAVAEVAEFLTGKGYELLSAQAEMVPQNTVSVTGEDDVKNLRKMLDMFEDNDDVQNVWHNWEEDE